MSNHRDRVTKGGNIPCRVKTCKRTFATEIREIRHYGLVHGPNAPWRRVVGLACPISDCERKFAAQQPMREHLRVDHEIADVTGILPTAADFRAFHDSGKKRKVGRPMKKLEAPTVEAEVSAPALPPFPQDLAKVLEAIPQNGDAPNNADIRLFVNAVCSKAQAVVDAYTMGAEYVIRTFQKELAHLEK